MSVKAWSKIYNDNEFIDLSYKSFLILLKIKWLKIINGAGEHLWIKIGIRSS